jgi:pantoate--beta-alanine ligase
MQVVSDIKQAHNLCRKWRDKGESISFVPTMGCLHDGHLSLINKAKSLADHVVVSIFVNPLQFDDVDDLLKYPNNLDADTSTLTEIDVSLIFIPEASSFYPEGEDNVKQVELGEITSILEGAHRPGHFAGVATVVKRLFEVIQPNFAIFGDKDFQQLMVIKQLVKKFLFDITIIGMPIFREIDGLAMSSRNIRLSGDERKKAPEIYRQLKSVKSAIKAISHPVLADFAELEQSTSENLVAAGFTPEYVAICQLDTLLPAKNYDVPLVILIAAKIGKIRLIDNILV